MSFLAHRRKHFRDSNQEVSLIAHYKINDDLGTTAVINTEGTNGTATVNTNTLHTTGKVGTGAFDFDEQYHFIANQTFESILQKPFTIAFWTKPHDGQPSTSSRFLGVYNDGFICDIVLGNSGSLSVTYKSDGNTAQWRTANYLFPDGATSWTHVIISFGQTEIVGYVNNAIPSNLTYDGDMTGVDMSAFVTSNPFSFGAAYFYSTAQQEWHLNGLLDDIRIYDGIIDDTERARIYNNGSGTED